MIIVKKKQEKTKQHRNHRIC